MTDNRTRLHRGLVSLIRQSYGKNPTVFNTTIPISVRTKESSAEGKSIFEHDGNGTVAEAYKKFTKEVLSGGKEERQRIKAERAVLIETETREAQEKQPQANGDAFDFNNTEIELDMDANTDRETGMPLREVRRFFPEDKVFSYDDKTPTGGDSASTIKLSSFDFISGDAPKPRMPKRNTPPSENSGSFISSDAPKKPAAEPAKAPVSSVKTDIVSDEDDIIKKAVAEADERGNQGVST
jgi:hypothetical protein